MNGFINYEEMFAQSIGIKEPWYTERAEYEEGSREVHIYVKARKTSKYPCPECGELCVRYDDEEKERVLAYFFARVTNAVAEGINSLIQSAKRRAGGFRVLESYKCMIYLVVGKLKLDCTPLFS